LDDGVLLRYDRVALSHTLPASPAATSSPVVRESVSPAMDRSADAAGPVHAVRAGEGAAQSPLAPIDAVASGPGAAAPPRRATAVVGAQSGTHTRTPVAASVPHSDRKLLDRPG
jgi:hypothetical protein